MAYVRARGKASYDIIRKYVFFKNKIELFCKSYLIPHFENFGVIYVCATISA